eukprot:CAMPEP_0113650950 /NCGR_PEP_ID=MMETSP0017_2-20120614/27141_1 /TAXON_ID=2856 /ORGANISM="Cylindrotheca closterium" /LENGTH=254 /DNA_ID=CAMNT_0000563555 /DNA_START=39 /DNA_END=799 /DNA_ORIENTATION=- /assembly_acc=CAM_ASM_000147
MEEVFINEYQFQNNEGEEVPAIGAQKLIVNPGVLVLPDHLCDGGIDLREITLPEGLTKIGYCAFNDCLNLLEIKIVSTVETIEESAFMSCQRMTKVEFESTLSSSPHQLKTIGNAAFHECLALQRIKIPSSVNMIEGEAFADCNVLVEAILSTTSIKMISSWLFGNCCSLQTVSLPNSLERICDGAFCYCHCLVTVIFPLDSQQPIEIGEKSFQECTALSNLVLPKGSNAMDNSFNECTLLQGRFGNEADDIVA